MMGSEQTDRAFEHSAELYRSQYHEKLLQASAISAEIANERPYYTETRRGALSELGYADYQCRPGLVIAIHGIYTKTFQLRPDSPRRNAKGKVVKYEPPAGTRMLLDMHPRARAWMGNPRVPLLITEGVRKADSALTAALLAHTELCTVAVAGVSTWRGRNEHGGLTALADWEGIALNRDVFIVYDSDAIIKADVRSQEKRLAKFIEAKKGKVKIIRLPHSAKDKKVGLDDYLAAGHTIADLLTLTTDGVEDIPATDGVSYPFRLTDAGVEFAIEEDGYVNWEWVCSPLKILANSRNSDGEDWGRLLIVVDKDGREHAWSLPMVLLAGDGVSYREHLLRVGLIIAPGRAARERLHMYISMTAPMSRVRSVSRLGWHNNTFVFANEVVR
jgi:hypothetical protein